MCSDWKLSWYYGWGWRFDCDNGIQIKYWIMTRQGLSIMLAFSWNLKIKISLEWTKMCTSPSCACINTKTQHMINGPHDLRIASPHAQFSIPVDVWMIYTINLHRWRLERVRGTKPRINIIRFKKPRQIDMGDWIFQSCSSNFRLKAPPPPMTITLL